MFLYLPIENVIVSPYLGRYRTFGLRILQSESEGDQEVMVLPDISTNFEFILRLASLCTRKQLNPLHILDVLEDLL